jgi:hypothetical protein
MIRFLLLVFFIWLIYKFIRGYLIIRSAARSYTRSQQTDPEPETPVKQPNKLISKDEGEYVDFEEVKH